VTQFAADKTIHSNDQLALNINPNTSSNRAFSVYLYYTTAVQQYPSRIKLRRSTVGELSNEGVVLFQRSYNFCNCRHDRKYVTAAVGYKRFHAITHTTVSYSRIRYNGHRRANPKQYCDNGIGHFCLSTAAAAAARQQRDVTTTNERSIHDGLLYSSIAIQQKPETRDSRPL
jgi:hypothetical protein